MTEKTAMPCPHCNSENMKTGNASEPWVPDWYMECQDCKWLCTFYWIAEDDTWIHMEYIIDENGEWIPSDYIPEEPEGIIF